MTYLKYIKAKQSLDMKDKEYYDSTREEREYVSEKRCYYGWIGKVIAHIVSKQYGMNYKSWEEIEKGIFVNLEDDTKVIVLPYEIDAYVAEYEADIEAFRTKYDY